MLSNQESADERFKAMQSKKVLLLCSKTHIYSVSRRCKKYIKETKNPCYRSEIIRPDRMRPFKSLTDIESKTNPSKINFDSITGLQKYLKSFFWKSALVFGEFKALLQIRIRRIRCEWPSFRILNIFNTLFYRELTGWMNT